MVDSWYQIMIKLINYFGSWKTLSAGSEYTKTHLCNCRISKFSGNLTGLADSLPRRQTHLPSCSNLNETPLILRSVHLTDTNFFPLVFWRRGAYCTSNNHKLISFFSFSFSFRHGSLNSLFCVTKHKILVKDLNTTKMRRHLNFINQLNIASI